MNLMFDKWKFYFRTSIIVIRFFLKDLMLYDNACLRKIFL